MFLSQRSILILLVAVNLPAFCQTAFAGDQAAEASGLGRPGLSGPRKTVAVAKFDAIGSFVNAYSGWDIGGGLEAMLTDALVASGKFIVVERRNLDYVLAEQKLSQQGYINPESRAEVGKLVGAQLLVLGSVTEFDMNTSGGGFNIGYSSSPFGGSLSPRSSKARFAMDVRIVDTTTGEVVESFHVEETLKKSSFRLNFNVKQVQFGTEQFDKTPLGKVTRRGIDRVVEKFCAIANGVPWYGRVVEDDLQEVYINAGASAGITVGDRFRIERVTKVLTDPATGQVLGRRRQELGTLVITGVEEKLAYGRYTPASESRPQRGDLVLLD